MAVDYTGDSGIPLVQLAVDEPLCVAAWCILPRHRLARCDLVLDDVRSAGNQCRCELARKVESRGIGRIARRNMAVSVKDGVVRKDVVGCDERCEYVSQINGHLWSVLAFLCLFLLAIQSGDM